MPRVTYVKSARKANPVVQKGGSYYWWKFRYGGKNYSLTRPRASQLTLSAYLGSVHDLIERVNEFQPELGEEGVIEDFRDEVVNDINEIRDECQQSLDNMPEQLQYAPTGELLQERIDACDSAEAECDGIEEPDQWQEVRDAQEEYDEWTTKEPVMADFDNVESFDEAHYDWASEEPDVEEFEDFDISDMAAAVEGMLI